MEKDLKDLLIKDLCARLPYGVKLHCYSNAMVCIGRYTLNTIVLDRIFNEDTEYVPFDEVKPYLFPLSSMTDEQYNEYWELEHSGDMGHLSIPALDWLNKNNFDYRGLIPMGLALDATRLDIY